jgi:transposase
MQVEVESAISMRLAARALHHTYTIVQINDNEKKIVYVGEQIQRIISPVTRVEKQQCSGCGHVMDSQAFICSVCGGVDLRWFEEAKV